MGNILHSEQEEWKDIPGQEGFYQVSNHGRIRSLDHYTYMAICKSNILIRGRIIKQVLSKDGYFHVTLTGGNFRISGGVHRLEWKIFKGQIPKGYEVDHIDNDKTNNRLSNLQLLSGRQNSAKRSMNLPKTSAYTGVSWCKARKKWQAHIRINKKSKSLGRYVNEIDAAMAYVNALKALRE
jgi:hypothetical protein